MSAAGSSWSQHMIAQDLHGIRANGLSEKTNFGAKIALSKLIDGAARKTYSGTQVIRLSRQVLKKPTFHRSTFS